MYLFDILRAIYWTQPNNIITVFCAEQNVKCCLGLKKKPEIPITLPTLNFPATLFHIFMQIYANFYLIMLIYAHFYAHF